MEIKKYWHCQCFGITTDKCAVRKCIEIVNKITKEVKMAFEGAIVLSVMVGEDGFLELKTK